MFLLRSAFWLGLAFMCFQPVSMAFNADSGAALADRTIATGQQIIAQKIAETECDSIQCIGGKAALSAVVATNSTNIRNVISKNTMSLISESNGKPIPFPHPRFNRES